MRFTAPTMVATVGEPPLRTESRNYHQMVYLRLAVLTGRIYVRDTLEVTLQGMCLLLILLSPILWLKLNPG
jgi:hypothetical protein